MKPILVIGGLNMDILGTPTGAFAAGDSLPGSIQLRPGGVGRNIAASLRQLGAPVELLTVIGDDVLSHALAASCEQRGIGLTYAVRVPGPACMYLAIHDHQGDMTAAINDMQAMAHLTAQHITSVPQDVFSACVLDANLSKSALKAAAVHFHAPLIADPVSAVKADRLRPILHQLTALKPNLLEARHYTGKVGPEPAAKALRDLGVQQVYLSMGRAGLWLEAQGVSQHISALHPSTQPATGAGDAMTAGIALAIAQGLNPYETAQMGISSADKHLNDSEPGVKSKWSI